jgi:hypothetical protein
MSITSYVTDSLLILLVFRQLRTSRLDLRAILLPLGIVAVVAQSYLNSIPTSGHDLELIGFFTVIGLLLGTGSGLATRVWSDGGRHPLVKAGAISAVLWVLGMGFRMGFSIWSSHGGDATLTRFSVTHHITGGNAWTAALVLMAVLEVVSRTAVLYFRGRRVQAAAATPPASAELIRLTSAA